MRPLLTLLLIVGLMSGMGAYIRFANSIHRETQEFTVDYATGKFEVVVQRSFDCVPFEIAEINALEIRLKGKVVFAANRNIPSAEPLRVSIDDGVEVGDNEIIVVANRDFHSEGMAAAQVTVLWNDIPLAEKTITAEPESEMLSGTVLFRVDAKEESEHRHP